jgi:hypothetical protein
VDGAESSRLTLAGGGDGSHTPLHIDDAPAATPVEVAAGPQQVPAAALGYRAETRQVRQHYQPVPRSLARRHSTQAAEQVARVSGNPLV